MKLSIEDLKKFIELRRKNYKHTTIVITGEEGSGKSYLAYNLLKLTEKEENIFYSFIAPTPLSILDDETELNYIKIQIEEALEKASLIVFDEAIDILFSRERSKLQNKLIKLLRKVRKYKKDFIFILPSILELDISIRERKFNLWLHGLGKAKQKYFVFAVIRGLYHGEIKFNLKHVIFYSKFGIYGWLNNKYSLGPLVIKFNNKLYREYIQLLNNKTQYLLKKLKNLELEKEKIIIFVTKILKKLNQKLIDFEKFYQLVKMFDKNIDKKTLLEILERRNQINGNFVLIK